MPDTIEYRVEVITTKLTKKKGYSVRDSRRIVYSGLIGEKMLLHIIPVELTTVGDFNRATVYKVVYRNGKEVPQEVGHFNPQMEYVRTS